MSSPKFTRLLPLAGALALAVASSGVLEAGTLVNSAGTLAIGVNDEGHFNTSVDSVAVNGGGFTGLAYNFGTALAPVFRDATTPDCLCEGFGVSATIGGGSASGYANVAIDGVVNLSAGAAAIGVGTITTTASLTSHPGLTITHVYQEATNAPAELWRAEVTITNMTGGTIDDVRYVRVMDWDVPLTEFDEFVTIMGTGTTTLLELSHDDGFESANPLDPVSNAILAGTTDVDFTDSSPADHGAFFRFNFGSLMDGESYTFNIFYGAAANETAALAAIAAEDLELFSLGQSNDGGMGFRSPTFIFGFSGVGGTPVIPEPMSLSILGLGLVAMGATRRRRKTAA